MDRSRTSHAAEGRPRDGAGEPPSRLRTAALAALVANVGIVLTGGVVRLSESGLGCDRWPTCDGTSVVPTGQEAGGWHTWVEFGNRLLTFVVLAAAVWVVLEARRAAATRADGRRLVRLAWLQPLGVVGQAVLGGVTVLTDLNPLVVAAHFLLSMAIIAAAVVLLDRVDGPHPPASPPGLRRLAPPLVATGAAVLVLGTLVTAAGPHAGDPGTPRLAMDIRTLAVAHADAVWLLVGLTVATAVAAHALDQQRLRRAALVLLAVEVAQGAVGYTQYALGIPEQVVAVHLLGAALTWVAVLRVALVLAPRPAGPIDPTAQEDAGDRAGTGAAPAAT